MGFGHRVYRAEDPRARVLRRTCRELGAPRYEAAAALEQAALAVLRERRPDRAIETNVEFWAAVILDFAGVPAPMMPAMFTCARTAGWSAHILEQKRVGPAGAAVGALRRARPPRPGGCRRVRIARARRLSRCWTARSSALEAAAQWAAPRVIVDARWRLREQDVNNFGRAGGR